MEISSNQRLSAQLPSRLQVKPKVPGDLKVNLEINNYIDFFSISGV